MKLHLFLLPFLAFFSMITCVSPAAAAQWPPVVTQWLGRAMAKDKKEKKYKKQNLHTGGSTEVDTIQNAGSQFVAILAQAFCLRHAPERTSVEQREKAAKSVGRLALLGVPGCLQ